MSPPRQQTVESGTYATASRPLRTWEPHGRECTPECKDLWVPSPLRRGREWVRIACPWCGAEPGSVCTVGTSGKVRRLALAEPHPSRREVAAV